MERWDSIVVGAGAAGLMAATWAARTAPQQRVLLLDGARKLGAKILVAGGGRCNVTHHAVSTRDFNGSTAKAIERVLRRFSVERTIEFFDSLGVRLKREETGKLFPVTDRARTVLDALLNAADRAGAEIRHPCRVVDIVQASEGESGFSVTTRSGDSGDAEGATALLAAKRVILATGGKALPKSGSDGWGLDWVRRHGLPMTSKIFPALVPLKLADGHFIRSLSGLTFDAALELRGPTGKRLQRVQGSTLCTHVGLSGPSVLDISRHFLAARADTSELRLVLQFLPGSSREELERELLKLGSATPRSFLSARLPQRLAGALCEYAGVSDSVTGHQLNRQSRRALAVAVTELVLPVTGDLGFTKAEVTAGGVPLSALHLATLESRSMPGLHLCGEICDVDGRIGGFNFQWAWASGFVAGTAVSSSGFPPPPAPGD